MSDHKKHVSPLRLVWGEKWFAPGVDKMVDVTEEWLDGQVKNWTVFKSYGYGIPILLDHDEAKEEHGQIIDIFKRNGELFGLAEWNDKDAKEKIDGGYWRHVSPGWANITTHDGTELDFAITEVSRVPKPHFKSKGNILAKENEKDKKEGTGMDPELKAFLEGMQNTMTTELGGRIDGLSTTINSYGERLAALEGAGDGDGGGDDDAPSKREEEAVARASEAETKLAIIEAEKEIRELGFEGDDISNLAKLKVASPEAFAKLTVVQAAEAHRKDKPEDKLNPFKAEFQTRTSEGNKRQDNGQDPGSMTMNQAIDLAKVTKDKSLEQIISEHIKNGGSIQ